MKFLLDQNLSRKLVPRLVRLFPKSSHVIFCGLEEAEDEAIWNYARQHGFTVVTQDSDYSVLAFARGAPPKVVWLRIGNATTAKVETILKAHTKEIRLFGREKKSSCFIINVV